jgi:hypothetical protein
VTLNFRHFENMENSKTELNNVVSKIIKKYRELAKECTTVGFKRYTLLVSDSKGACIRRAVPSLARFDILSKAGAIAADKFINTDKQNRGQEESSGDHLVWDV